MSMDEQMDIILRAAHDHMYPNTSYSDRASLTVLGPEEKSSGLVKRVTDMTGGKALSEELESVYY